MKLLCRLFKLTHFSVPNNPCNSEGIYKSVSTFGKYRPKPEGDISISAKSVGCAFSNPCTVVGENDNSNPDEKLMVIRSFLVTSRPLSHASIH